MAILLDTPALIWSLNDSKLLTSTARKCIREAETGYLSPINFYEIAIKVALGRDAGINLPMPDIIKESLLSGFV